MPGGRPRQYETVEEMESIIEDYFGECDKDHPPCITGLALALNLTRRGLLDYEGREEFAHTITKAKMRVQAVIEQRHLAGSTPAAAGIFNLVNNFGWENRARHEHTGRDGGPIEVDDAERASRLHRFLKSGSEEGTGSDT